MRQRMRKHTTRPDGPGEAISAAAKETYNNHKLNNIYKNPEKSFTAQ